MRFNSRAQSLRSFGTTSMGRLFDTAAAITGFTREITFEGQAAMWLERLARGSSTNDAYPFPFRVATNWTFRPLLGSRDSGRPPRSGSKWKLLARFSVGIAKGFATPFQPFVTRTEPIRLFFPAAFFKTICF